jgi:hypothetical protein
MLSHADEQPRENTFQCSVSQSYHQSRSCKFLDKMKTLVICFFLCKSLVLSRPQNSAGSFSTFSNFDPKTQRFTVGTNPQLSKTLSSSQNSFFQSIDAELDGLVPEIVLGATGFDGLANTGFNPDFIDPSLLLDISFDVFSAATGKYVRYLC